MLDLTHPQAPHRFAASKQLDLILDYCKRITLQGESGRRFMLEVARPAFAALRWLNEQHFRGSPDIRDGVNEFEAAAESLVRMPLVEAEPRQYKFSRCPVCGDSPEGPDKYDPTPYCSRCLYVIIPALSRLRSSDRGFGTEAI
jgi:hypothetical protein